MGKSMINLFIGEYNKKNAAPKGVNMKQQQSKHPNIYLTVVLTLLGGLLIAQPSSAQTTPKDNANGETSSTATTADAHRHHWKKKSMGSLYLHGGVADIDLDALNGRLSRSGYDTIDAPAVPMGFGFTHRFERFIAGVDWHFLMHRMPETPDENMRMDMRTWYWQLNYGYDIVQLKNFSVYALAGAGLGHASIWISDERGESFNGVLREPARSIYMTQTSFVVSATAGADYRIETGTSKHRTTYFTVGVRGGYVFSPFTGDWRTHAAEIQNGPERGLNGPVALITLGITRKRLE